jgi:hypothetical protein
MPVVGMYVPLPDLVVVFFSSNSSLTGVYNADEDSDGSIDQGRLVIRIGDEYEDVWIIYLQH